MTSIKVFGRSFRVFACVLPLTILFKISNCLDAGPCMTGSCIKAAAMILSNMNTEIDPCSDFYQFACGKFEEKYSLYDSVDAIHLGEPKYKIEVRELLKDVLASDEEDMQALKLFHTSCVNADSDDDAKFNSIVTTLEKIGIWPLLHDYFDEESFDWVEYNERLIDTGIISGAFIHLGINTGDDSPQFSVKALKIFLTNLRFDISWFYNYTKSSGKKTLIEALIFSHNTSDDLLSNVTLLSHELQKANSCKTGFEDEEVKISALYNISSRIDWLRFINNQYSPYSLTVSNYVRIDHCTYSILPDIVSILEATPKRVVATFMLMKVMQDLLTELSSYHGSFKKVHTQNAVRLKKCVSTEIVYFPLQIFKMYLNKYISPEIEKSVTLIMRNVYSHLVYYVTQANWLLRGTRRLMEDVVKSIRAILFLPKHYQDVVSNFSSLVNLTESDFLQNLLQLSKAKFKLRLRKTVKSERDYLFDMALYKFNVKSLSAHLYVSYVGLSPALFRGSFFAIDRPMSMNYGSLGFMFGHELIHAINKYFVEYTTIAKKDKISHNLFRERANCVVETSKNLVVKALKLKHRGNVTMSEELADIDGARLAYKAYKKWVQSFRYDTHIPGVNFTSNQLFWMQLANSFCSFDNTFLWKGMGNDSHPHEIFRVWAMVSHNSEFAEDFNCPKYSPMNPGEKCHIWVTDEENLWH